MSAETGSAEAAKRPGPCFLIKLARGHGLASASTHELRGVPFSVRPLFGSAVGLDEFGAAAEGGWVVAEPMVGGAIAAAAGLDTAPQWQLAHEMYDRMAGGAEIVEPDLLQDGAALATRRKGPDDGTPFAGAPENLLDGRSLAPRPRLQRPRQGARARPASRPGQGEDRSARYRLRPQARDLPGRDDRQSPQLPRHVQP